jgi:hypothetical protein
VGSATVIKQYDTILDANMCEKFSFFNKNSILVFKKKASMRFVQKVIWLIMWSSTSHVHVDMPRIAESWLQPTQQFVPSS